MSVLLGNRVPIGLLLGAAVVAALLWLPAWAVLGLLLLVTAVAQLEFYALLEVGRAPSFKVLGVAAGLAFVAAAGAALWPVAPGRLGGPLSAGAPGAGLLIVFALLFVAVLRQVARRDDPRPWETIGGTLAGFFCVAFTFSFVARLLGEWDLATGRLHVLYLLIVVKGADVGAFLVGCGLGRHKLIPRISPLKTWEGLAGGLLAGLLASALMALAGGLPSAPWTAQPGWAALLGLGLAAAGVVGDLAKSVFKRAAGVKDSGRLFGGLGGLLDVIDSVLFAAPVLYFVLRAWGANG